MNVRKLICVILTFCIMLSVLATVSADLREEAFEITVDDAYFRLSSLKIIPEDLILKSQDGYVTRKEFAGYITALISYDGIRMDETVLFEDVGPSQYSDCVNTIAALGYMSGNGAGKFYPDAHIKFEEAVKVLVEVLGYLPLATEKGGYPGGYIAVASQLGILKNVSIGQGSELDLKNLAMMFDAALEADMLVKNYDVTNPLYTLESESRLLEIRLKRLNLAYGSGVVEANEYTHISGSVNAPEGCVVIDGYTFNAGDTEAADMIGVEVEFYAENKNNGKITSIRYASEIHTVSTDAGDIVGVENYLITYCDTDGEEDEIKLDKNYKLIYNGKNSDTVVSKPDIPEVGSITFSDTDSDRLYDIVRVYEAVYAGVEKVDYEYGRIYFENSKINGKEYVDFDEEIIEGLHTVSTISGDEVGIEMIKPGDILMIYASRDGALMQIYIADEYIAGKVSEISDDGYVIDGVAYPVWETQELMKNVGLGSEGFFRIAGGVIVGYSESRSNENTGGYALVHAIKNSGSLEKAISLRLISGCSYKIVEEDTDDDKMTDTRFVKLSNTNVTISELDDYVRLNGDRIRKDDVPSYMNPPYTVIKYDVNTSGKIDKIDILQKHQNLDKRTLNTGANLFGATIGGTFAYDDTTTFFVIPQSGTDNFDDAEYFSGYKFKNKQSYNALGFDVDSETKLAKAALIVASPDCVDGAINASTKISIVLKNSEVFDSDGNATRRISGYTGSERFEKLVSDSAIDVAENLEPGDLIYYSTDYSGRINQINVFKKISMLSDFYSRKGSIEEYYGIAENVICMDVTEYATDLVDTLTLDVSPDESYKILENVPVSCTVVPPVYLYDRKHNVLGFSSTGDIQSVMDCGYDSASKVYVYKSESAVRVVLIIND